jgi:two-component system sporulation sensor kinase B
MNDRTTRRVQWANSPGVYPAALAALSLIAPAFLNVRTFGIMRLLWSSLESGQIIDLLDAAIRMAILNALRAFPIYLSAFTLGGAAEARLGRRNLVAVILIPAVVVPLGYTLIDWIYGITYDFRMPAVLSILAVAAVLRMGRTQVSQETWKTAAVVGILVFGLQWLDLAPALTRWGFGHGEISMDIKSAGEVLGAASLLNTYTVSMCATLVSMGLLLSKVMVEYRIHIRLVEEDRRRSLELAHLQTEAMRARTGRELDHLMHDLRTPLTTIQGLSSTLAEYPFEADPAQTSAYARRISEAADRMDGMIREMLYGSHTQRVPAQVFARKLASQLPDEKTGGIVEIVVADDLPCVTINATRLTRGIINLIDNAIDAGSDMVKLEFRRDGAHLCISVADNGAGMNEQDLARCLNGGFSTKDSTGLGLPFAAAVVKDHGGTMRIESATEEVSRRTGAPRGTVVTIMLPEARDACEAGKGDSHEPGDH